MRAKSKSDLTAAQTQQMMIKFNVPVNLIQQHKVCCMSQSAVSEVGSSDLFWNVLMSRKERRLLNEVVLNPEK